jgi:F-type H+-transporting ATPase subunit delta
VSARGSAARYARALLEVGVKEKHAERMEQELASVNDLLMGHADLWRVLTNPAIPIAAKRGMIQDLVRRAAPSRPVGKLLQLLADRDRLMLLPDVLAVYRERLMDYQQVVRAEVTTAVALPDDRAERLKERLAHMTGRQVTVTTRVDPSIIGGVVTRIGSTVYDGSVATQLKRMRDRLLER